VNVTSPLAPALPSTFRARPSARCSSVMGVSSHSRAGTLRAQRGLDSRSFNRRSAIVAGDLSAVVAGGSRPMRRGACRLHAR
jgi:hypothetical protein